jgi:hypothetical protein
MATEVEAKAPDRRARGPIRVTLPASVAYDPDRLKTSLGDILDQIGCRACCSGADILLEMERSFAIDADAKSRSVAESGQFFGGELRRSHQFTVGLSQNVKYDIDRVFEAIDRVIDVLGAHPCISGYDVLLQNELRTIVVDADLEVKRFDRGF